MPAGEVPVTAASGSVGNYCRGVVEFGDGQCGLYTTNTIQYKSDIALRVGVAVYTLPSPPPPPNRPVVGDRLDCYAYSRYENTGSSPMGSSFPSPGPGQECKHNPTHSNPFLFPPF